MALAFAKIKGKNMCKKLGGMQPDNLRDLSHSKQSQANMAKKASLEILQDALDKKFYSTPTEFWPSCDRDPDPYKYSSILTQELLENMIETMKKVTFLEDTDPENCNCFAYVFPDDQSCTVHLCDCFWSADDYLSRDSKPGVLIHEVSHFLGTEDVTYDFVWIELHEKMEKMGKTFGTRVGCEENVTKILGGDGSFNQKNANSIEYEFEMILNHKTPYSEQNQKYPCCGESKINSVCTSRDIGHYVNKLSAANLM